MSSTEQSTDNQVVDSNADKLEKISAANQKKDSPRNNKSTSKRGANISIIFIITILAASAGAYYYWLKFETYLQKIEHDSQLLSNKYSDTVNKLNEAGKQLLDQQRQVTQLNEQLNLQNDKLNAFDESQQSLISMSKNIFDITHRNQSQWILSEVSYLLSLANQRLIISRDIKTATAALKAANNRLHDLSDPSLLTLRKTIAKETAQLNLLKLPDINGIAFNLDNITLAINALPFKSAQQKYIESKQAPEKVEITSLDKDSVIAPLWERLKSLVTVKRHQRNIQETVTPLQKNDIDNQLKYRLETSRVALISKNTTVFQHEINSALLLVSTYYNQSDNRVASLLTELTSISKIDLLPDLPDISGSWLALQKFIAINNASISLKKNKGKSKK